MKIDPILQDEIKVWAQSRLTKLFFAYLNKKIDDNFSLASKASYNTFLQKDKSEQISALYAQIFGIQHVISEYEKLCEINPEHQSGEYQEFLKECTN